MKSITASLTVLAAGLALASTLSMTHPRPAYADGDTTTAAAAAAPADNQFLDGNWFTIAEAKGENYVTGSPTEQALQAQLAKYQAAADASPPDYAQEEHFAIRSWVKGWVALAVGENALDSGDLATAKACFARAKKYGRAAQKPNAGLGETASRVNDDSAPAFGGTSAIEGARVVAQASKDQAALAAKSGGSADSE
jgi:hypothetical protein